MEESPLWELEALSYLMKKMEVEEDEGDFGFEGRGRSFSFRPQMGVFKELGG